MSTTLAIIRPEELDTLQRAAKLLAASNYFDGKGEGPQAVAMMATKILAGREMGFGPFASVNGVHIISGKPTIGANLMASAVKGSGKYTYRIKELTNQKCVLYFHELVGGKWEFLGDSVFTIADAQAAGVMNNPTWKKFPRNMLFSRALSNGVRWHCPDIFLGNAVYTPDELGGEEVIDAEMSEVRDPNPPIDVSPKVVDSRPQRTQQVLPEEEFPNKPEREAQVAAQMTGAAEGVDMDEPPDDHEFELLESWRIPLDAQRWAIDEGYCENKFHAQNSWVNSVKACGGYDSKNARQVMLHFLRHQTTKPVPA